MVHGGNSRTRRQSASHRKKEGGGGLLWDKRDNRPLAIEPDPQATAMLSTRRQPQIGSPQHECHVRFHASRTRSQEDSESYLNNPISQVGFDSLPAGNASPPCR